MQTLAEERGAHTPAILELLSEIEKRDRDSKGSVQPAHIMGADPRGLTVINTTGHDVGKVEDLYVDPNTRNPRFALLTLGNHPLGINDRRVLVDFEDVEVENDNQVRVRVTI
jgi:hypothetical protein